MSEAETWKIPPQEVKKEDKQPRVYLVTRTWRRKYCNSACANTRCKSRRRCSNARRCTAPCSLLPCWPQPLACWPRLLRAGVGWAQTTMVESGAYYACFVPLLPEGRSRAVSFRRRIHRSRSFKNRALRRDLTTIRTSVGRDTGADG